MASLLAVVSKKSLKYLPPWRKTTSPYFIVVAFLLLVNPLLSFAPLSISRTTSRRISSSKSMLPIDISHFSCQQTDFTSKTTRLQPVRLSLSLRRERLYDDEDKDDYYYENEEKETDYPPDDYGTSSYYEELETNGESYRLEERDSRETTEKNYYDDDDGDEVLNDDDGDYRRSGGARGRGGYYQVSFNEVVDPSETEIDWEVCTSSDSDSRGKGRKQALVLLPPAAVERPTAIIHFVGGTFFGSNPKLWYRSLLESIVRSTSAAIVVTPIPVTIFKNPLQHVELSQKLQASFEHAWFTVLEDEYGNDVLQDIPLCGLGHSLGSRLLTVLTTLNKNKPSEKREGRATKACIPPYKSMVLISFTNYGANVGIPGVAALRKQSNKQQQFKKKKSIQDRRGRKSSSRNIYSDYDRYDHDYDLFDNGPTADEEWADLVEDLQETVSEQANWIQTALTPNAKDLEFVPSPDRLWKAIREDSRYDVNTTLVVQFDDDEIDQSSQLAQALHSTNSSDVRFARLRGNHLTPVSVIDNNYDDSGNGTSEKGRARVRRRVRQRNSADKFGAMIEKTIKGNNKNRRDKIAMRDLRLSIISYITDVVTK